MATCPGVAPPQTAHDDAPHPDCPECGDPRLAERELDLSLDLDLERRVLDELDETKPIGDR